MAKFVFAMNISLDGYVDHEAFEPGAELFQHWIEMTRSSAGGLYGRGIYELMRYWEAPQPEWGPQEHAFAEAWRSKPIWVASRSLKEVGPGATRLGDDLEAAARKLKQDVEGRIDVGGPKLAASLTKLGLIDEYQLYVRPYVLGKGAPYFVGAQPPLKLIAHEEVGEDALRLTYVPS